MLVGVGFDREFLVSISTGTGFSPLSIKGLFSRKTAREKMYRALSHRGVKRYVDPGMATAKVGEHIVLDVVHAKATFCDIGFNIVCHVGIWSMLLFEYNIFTQGI